MTADADEALDVISETVMITYQKLDTVRDTNAFLGFILTVARNVHIRSRRRLSIFRPLFESDSNTFPSLGPSPEESADVRLLYDALAQLPIRQREAVILFEIVGLPLSDIRSVQGGTLSGVKARVVRGRRNLTAILRPDTTPNREPVPRPAVRAVDDIQVSLPMRLPVEL